MRISPLLLSLLLLPLFSFGQLVLTIEVIDLRNNEGKVHLELSNDNEEQVTAISKNIFNKKCVFVIENVKPGRYAFKFIHDENKNDKLDTKWMGIPKEGFGFSNNPSITFGPPSFDKTIFELNESIVIDCKPKYF